MQFGLQQTELVICKNNRKNNYFCRILTNLLFVLFWSINKLFLEYHNPDIISNNITHENLEILSLTTSLF